jgi:transposase
MVTFGSTQRYYIYQGGVDMRKGFDGLHGLVVNHLGRTGLEGDVYLFFNRQRTQVKMLVWDRSGFVIYYKRLERGRFEDLGPVGPGKSLLVTWGDLQMIMEGIDLKSARRRKRYEIPQLG